MAANLRQAFFGSSLTDSASDAGHLQTEAWVQGEPRL